MTEREKRLERALRDLLDDLKNRAEMYRHHPSKDVRAHYSNPQGETVIPVSDGRLAKAEEALADDGAGEPPCPKHTKGNGPCYCQPPDNTPNRYALEALDRVDTLVRDIPTDAVAPWEYAEDIDAIRHALTAPPTVPEAVRRLPGELHEEAANTPEHNDYSRGVAETLLAVASRIDRALAQHSEPGRIPEGWSIEHLDDGRILLSHERAPLVKIDKRRDRTVYALLCDLLASAPAPDADEREKDDG